MELDPGQKEAVGADLHRPHLEKRKLGASSKRAPQEGRLVLEGRALEKRILSQTELFDGASQKRAEALYRHALGAVANVKLALRLCRPNVLLQGKVFRHL